MDKVPYNDLLQAGRQMDAEEKIAAMILDHPDVDTSSDATAEDLGCDILYEVLREFRPDLFEDDAGVSDVEEDEDG